MKRIYKTPILRMVELEDSNNLCADSGILDMLYGGVPGEIGDKAEAKRRKRNSGWDDDEFDDEY